MISSSTDTHTNERKNDTPSENDIPKNTEVNGNDALSNNDDITEDTRRDMILLGSQPRGLYECDYCGTDLTRSPRIRCAECPDFDLCLECFATEDHEHMARYKREEEARRRRDAAKLQGLELHEARPPPPTTAKGGAKKGG